MSATQLPESDTGFAVLVNQFPNRLDQALAADKITFRSGNAWTGAADTLSGGTTVAVYFKKTGGHDVPRYVTHKALVTDIVVHPEEHPDATDHLRSHLPADDPYREYNDPPKTLYLVTDCVELDEPVPHSEFVLANSGANVDENLRRGHAYVEETL